MVAMSSSVCALNLKCGRKSQHLLHPRCCEDPSFPMLNLPYSGRSIKVNHIHGGRKRTPNFAKSRESEESVPSWAKLDSDEPPPWARNEGKPNEMKEGTEFPFFVYLLASAITAIAAIGSIFEYVNQKPVFGILDSDSILYAPVLGFFAFTGIPTSAFLWYKSVQVANKEAEEQDKRDGL
ncbi:Zinc finger protein BRUTUS [Bienertia sinuspersici]